MVPEKMAAFSKAGASALADLQAMQADALANWQQMMGIMVQGRSPTNREMSAMTSRSARMTSRAAAAGGKALAPIHRTATGNVLRRLAGPKSRQDELPGQSSSLGSIEGQVCTSSFGAGSNLLKKWWNPPN